MNNYNPLEQYERIKNLCAVNRITMAALSAVINVSKSTFTGVKSGRVKSFSASTLQKIADYFGVSVDYLVTGEEEKKAATEDDVKVALFGGDGEVTDEMWKEALDFVEYIKERNKKKKSHDK